MMSTRYNKKAMIARKNKIQQRLIDITLDWANYGFYEEPRNEQKRLQAVKAGNHPALKTLRWKMATWGLYPAAGSLP